MNTVFDFSATTLDGQVLDLSSCKGKVLLIVNTASACGFTPQLAGLEQLHQRYADQGLVIMGFPCNQFANQDPGDAAQIAQFCERNFGVHFQMMAKVEVNGVNTHPLYAWVKQQAPGLLGTRAIKWNFTKFLVGRDGRVLQRFAPQTPPAKLSTAIEQALQSH